MRRTSSLALALLVLVSVAATTSTAQAAARQKAPPIAGKSLTGTKVSLGKLRGKPVFVNVWSSW
jgi:hypothetical protein